MVVFNQAGKTKIVRLRDGSISHTAATELKKALGVELSVRLEHREDGRYNVVPLDMFEKVINGENVLPLEVERVPNVVDPVEPVEAVKENPESEIQSVTQNPDIEIIKAEYFDSDAIKAPELELRRVSVGSTRYYTYNGEAYPGVTSVLDKVIPMEYGLFKWIIDKGQNQAGEDRDRRAAFGTAMHAIISRFLVCGNLNIEEVGEIMAEFLPDFTLEELEEQQQNIIAFAQFCSDTDLRPIMIEAPVVSAAGYAGCLDLFCELTIKEKGFFGEVYKSGAKKGEPKETTLPKRITAYVDYKSGRNQGFYTHEVQLQMYANAANECYGVGDSETRLYNWHPKDWRTTPGYNLIDNTGKVSANIIKCYLDIFYERGFYTPEKTIKEYAGVLILGEQPNAFERRKEGIV